MADWNFPNNPNVGDKYSFDVKTWVWNGSAWDLLTVSDSVLEQVQESLEEMEDILPVFSETPPVAPIRPGQTWVNTTTGRKFLWVTDEDSSQWVEVEASFIIDNKKALAELAEPDGASKIGLPYGTVADGINYVTPEMFGAVGDGAANDTVAMQAALNAGQIVVASKRYAIDAPLVTAMNGQTVQGQGTFVAIGTWGNRDMMLVVSHDNVSVSGVTFDAADKPIGAIGALGYSGTKIEGITAKNTGWLAIQAGGVSEGDLKAGVRIENVRLSNNGHIIPSDGWSGIRLECAIGAVVRDVVATGQAGKAVSFSICFECVLDAANVSQSSTEQAGIYLARGAANKVSNCTVTGLKYPLKFSRQETATVAANCYLDSSGFGGVGYATVLFQGSMYCKLVDSMVISGVREGVMFETHPPDSDPYTPSDCIGNSVERCTIRCSDAGARYLVYFLTRGDAAPKICQDNSVVDCLLEGLGNTTALVVAGNADNTRIVGVKGSGASSRAIILSGSSGWIEGCEIDHSGAEALYAITTTAKDLTVLTSTFRYNNASTIGFADIRYAGTVTIKDTNVSGASGTSCASIQNSTRLLVSGCDFNDTTNKVFFVSGNVSKGLINGNSSTVAISVGGSSGVTVGTNYVL